MPWDHSKKVVFVFVLLFCFVVVNVVRKKT